MENVSKNLVRDLVCSEKKSYIQVSEILQEVFPQKIGFSRNLFKDTACRNQYHHGLSKKKWPLW